MQQKQNTTECLSSTLTSLNKYRINHIENVMVNDFA